MLLSDQEVVALTGKSQKQAQIDWLVDHGWKFEVNALGRAKVAVAEFNRKMVGGRAVREEPNYSALNG